MMGSGFLALFLALTLQAGDAPRALPLIETGLTVAATVRSADSAANRKSERVVCRSESKANSRFTRRVCRKQKDWVATADQAQDDFGKVQGRSMASTIPGN